MPSYSGFHQRFSLALCALLCIVLGNHFSRAQNTTSPVVNLGYAKVQGVIDPTSGNTQFLGLRFAAPPLGNLRFSAPQPPLTQQGVQLANTLPAQCLQASSGSAPTSPFRLAPRAVASSEDCLFLNVFVPGTLNPSKRLPVVVWIHGGGYVAGGGSTFNGNDLIREANGELIAVVIQYRLGLFGFLPGTKVKQGGALNAGLLDQQAALRWVQSHIKSFGGDPGEVTIWGQSAGAGSVLQHIIANDGNTQPPLFRAGITSSSFLPSQYKFNDRIPETLFSEVANQTNCATARDTLACLRAADVNALEAANTAICSSGFFGTFVFVPVVDGTLITERPTQLFKQNKVNGKFLLSMTNTFEGAAFVNAATASTVQVPDYISQLFPTLNKAQVNAAAAQYAGLGFTPINQAIAIMGEAIFICPTYLLLQGFTGSKFKGEFAIPPGGHGQDVAFYFPSGGAPSFNNTAFSTAFDDAFMSIIVNTNPNNKIHQNSITPHWQNWNLAGKAEMLFNRTAGGEPVVHPITTSNALLERCNFWQSVGATTGQ